MENFASKKGFDPLQPDNWYKVSPFDIRAEKVMRYYNFWVPVNSRIVRGVDHFSICTTLL